MMQMNWNVLISLRNRQPVSLNTMIKAKNVIMKERVWINRTINETTSETHCEATGYLPPVRQYRNVEDCRVHTCGPHRTCIDGSICSSYCDSGFQKTKITFYLKEDQSEFLEERRHKNLSYMSIFVHGSRHEDISRRCRMEKCMVH